MKAAWLKWINRGKIYPGTRLFLAQKAFYAGFRAAKRLYQERP